MRYLQNTTPNNNKYTFFSRVDSALGSDYILSQKPNLNKFKKTKGIKLEINNNNNTR